MNSEKAHVSKQVALIIDSLFMILAFFATYYLREPFKHPPFEKLAPVGYYFWLLSVTLPFSWISLLIFGVYSADPHKRGFWRLFSRFCFSMLFVLSVVFFVIGFREINRSLVIPFVLVSAFFFAIWRVLFLRWQKSRGQFRKALIVGEGPNFLEVIEGFKNDAYKDFELVGVLTDEVRSGEEIMHLPVIGRLENLHRILHDEVVDEVIFACPLKMMEKYRTLLTICETLGVDAMILIEDQWPRFSRIDVGKVLNRPFVYLGSTPVGEAASWTKEILDRAIAFIVLLITFPLFVLIGILVKLTSKGPVFFVQERTGLSGRKFLMYKFRTMQLGAAEMKGELQSMNEMEGPVFKIRKDPRVTKIGSLLRKYSLDELPQFVNILRGDMSLVGPRPLPCEEAAQIQGNQRRRFSVKPGLTCIWQISGRNQIGYQEWMDLDLQYIDQWSLRLDLEILLKTPGAILSSKGAF
jgi:exopolysaccharide biosynthesis polyprenyl glycosylphosphotransferase